MLYHGFMVLLYQSVMDIIVKANAEKFQEVKEEMCEALLELMEDEIKEQVEERVTEQVKEQIKKQLDEAEAKGLKALVDVLKGLPLDFDSAYQAIIRTEVYAKISKRQVMAYWESQVGTESN